MTNTSSNTFVLDGGVWWQRDRIPSGFIYRWAWMRLMGVDDDEIDRHIAEDPPVNDDEEFEHLKAMHAVYLMQNRDGGG